MTVPAPRKISIVGGGFSGMSLAYFLVSQGFQVQIFEKQRWGGMISTKVAPEMQVESAANGFLNTFLLQQMSQDIQCQLLPTLPAARKRFIFRGKILRQWPVGFASTLKLISFVGKYIFSKNSLAPFANETVAAWTRRTLNAEILAFLVAPGLQGVYAGDVEKLSASLILGSFFKEKKRQNKVKRGTVAPALGMGEFIVKLKSYLESSGVDFVQAEVKDLQTLPRPVVLAVGPAGVSKLFDSDWSRCHLLGLVKVSLGFQKPQKRIAGFGILFPPAEKMNSLGVLCNSHIFSNRGDLYNESWILGGAHNSEILQKSDTEILNLISEDRERSLGAKDAIMSYDIVRWPQALPHYTIELEEFLKNYKSADQEVFLTGNFLGQLGLSKILEFNSDLAQKIKEKYG